MDKRCTKCGDGVEARKKFCNSSCAASFNNIGRVRNKRNPDNYCECGRRKSKHLDRCWPCTPVKCRVIKPRYREYKMRRYGPYKSNDGHLFYIIRENGKSKSIWAHREIMEQHLGRKLSPDEVLHHIDGDKENNDLSNLAIMSVSEHMSHHHPIVMCKFICPMCGNEAIKKYADVKHNRRRGCAGPFCGNSCAGKWSTSPGSKIGKAAGSNPVVWKYTVGSNPTRDTSYFARGRSG